MFSPHAGLSAGTPWTPILVFQEGKRLFVAFGLLENDVIQNVALQVCASFAGISFDWRHKVDLFDGRAIAVLP